MTEQIAELRCPMCGSKSHRRYTSSDNTIRDCTNAKCRYVFSVPTYGALLRMRNAEQSPAGLDEHGNAGLDLR